VGVRPIRVKRIVGSAGKADKIDAGFRPLGAGPAAANFRAILGEMKRGTTLPPISVYQIGSRYFVIDGHTRVAAARELGLEFIDAEVSECLPRKEGEVNLTYYARSEFERATGLEGVRLTAPWRYHLLHRHIEGYRLYLEHSWGREVSLREAARIWYRTQYRPTVMEIERRKLTSSREGRTAGDVYTDILKAWAEKADRAVSMREMLDYYDETQMRQQPALTRARRKMADVVDASLPKRLPRPRPRQLADRDVEAELNALPFQAPDGGAPS
jgi:hypothetical protein